MNALYTFMHYLPKNLVSFLCGLLARLTLPEPFSILLNKLFITAFGIDMREASQELSAYRNIEAVFTRQLKPGQRPIEPGIVSPADGFLSYSLPLARSEGLIQAKGLSYSAEELVYGAKPKAPGGLAKAAWFSTIYLAPHNYHRVHTPLAGRLVTMRYIPGELWPVNEVFVPLVPRLFCRNERLVFEIEASAGGNVYAVMVGALNVGRIASKHWPDFVTNTAARQLARAAITERRPSEPIVLAAGDELGVFMLGSTVVLIFEDSLAERFALASSTGKRPVRMGQSLGKGLTGPSDET